MRKELIELLEKLTVSDFNKVKQLYKMTNQIKGDTIKEFADNVPDKVLQGVINLCKKQLSV